MDRKPRVNERFRQLPAVDVLVDSAANGTETARWSLLSAARAALEEARNELRASPDAEPPDLTELARRVRSRAAALERPAPRRVLNGTGVVLHTNLGRAPLGEVAIEAMREASRGYSDLELDLESGERGSRLSAISELICEVSGAEAALVVNNNAAAVLLCLDTLAPDREVVLSRGELVEIGGSFRVPDIMASSRARLTEIGTTNRTHLADYRNAVGPDTGLLLKVHRSNFDVVGFTAEVGLEALAELSRETGVPLVEDRGSGSFVDLRDYGIPEPPAHSGLAAGADLVMFSGDKLLGGPQAGIIVGRADLVGRLRKSPLARALRVDKLTLAALHATVRSILDGEAERHIPVLRMLATPLDVLRARAERLAKAIEPLDLGAVSLIESPALVGGGSLPGFQIPGVAVRIEPRRAIGEAGGLARRLRRGDPPLVVRVQQGGLLVDPRTLSDEECDEVRAAFSALFDRSH